jgi:hypothetical protein
MPSSHLINVDLVKVFRSHDRKGLLNVLMWEASVDVIDIKPTFVKVKATAFEKLLDGSVKAKKWGHWGHS